MARELEHLVAQGARLRELRGPLPGGGYRIGQQAAADAADVTLRGYQAYESGSSDIKWEKVERLATFFGVDPIWIVEGETGPSQLDLLTESVLDIQQALLNLAYGLRASAPEGSLSRRLFDEAAARLEGSQDDPADEVLRHAESVLVTQSDPTPAAPRPADARS